MKTYKLQVLVLFFSLIIAPAILKAQNNITQANLISDKLVFEENKGQILNETEEEILFRLKNSDIDIFFLKNKVILQYSSLSNSNKVSESKGIIANETNFLIEKQEESTLEVEHIFFNWVNSNNQVEVIGQDRNLTYSNYYLDHCQSGVLEVKNYQKIVYKNLYDGIDCIFYIKDNKLKFDYHVSTDANYKDVQWNFSAQNNMIQSQDGLYNQNSLGWFKEFNPISFQDNKTLKTTTVYEDGNLKFDIPKIQNSDKIIIDPMWEWGTYSGGTGWEMPEQIAADQFGNTFVTGQTDATSGLIIGPHQTTFGGQFDAYVIKYDNTGNKIWATFYGGTAGDGGNAVVVDNENKIYVGGSTCSSTGIAQSGWQNGLASFCDAFLVKFNQSGGRIWGTYYGGNSGEGILDLAVDNDNNLYASGSTGSSNNIAAGGFQNTYVPFGSSAFLVKFNSQGSRIWGTYYGQADYDYGTAVACDKDNNVIMGGSTTSQTGISHNGHQSSFGGGSGDGYLVKFNSSGGRLWATYYGGSNEDEIKSIDTDDLGNIFAIGNTRSTNNISFNGHQDSLGGINPESAFIVKFNSSGTRQWATYYGGSCQTTGSSILIDQSENVLIAGGTCSSTNIAFNGYINTFGGGRDGYAALFENSGTRIWGSYYGQNHSCDFFDIASDKSGGYYFLGETQSPNPPGSSGIHFGTGSQSSYGGGTIDGILIKITESCPPITFPESDLIGGADSIPYGMTFSTSGTGFGTPIGRTGGLTYHISDVALADTTRVFFGSDPDTFFLSFRGYTTPIEFMKYRDDLSILCDGKIVWRGETRFSTAPGLPIYTQFILEAKYSSGETVQLYEPDSSGLNHNVGALFEILKDSAYDINLRFQVTDDTINGIWSPALDFFDSWTVGPSYNGLAFSSYASSYFWINSKPNVDVNAGLTVMEGASATIANSNLSFSDLESSVDSVYMTISSLPAHGSIFLDGVNAPIGSTIIQTDIDSSKLVFQHNGDENPTDTLWFTISDENGLYGQFMGDSLIPFIINVSPVNDRPAVSLNNTLLLDEADTAVIDSTIVYFNDPDNDNDSLEYILLPGIAGLPTNGILQLNGSDITSSIIFRQEDVSNGTLRYIHDGSTNFQDTFSFYVRDPIGAFAISAGDSIYSLIISISPVNDPPKLTINAPLIVNEGGTNTILPNKLTSTDEESPNDSIFYEYGPGTGAPVQYGVLTLNGVPLVDGDFFTQKDIDSANVVYTHDGSETFLDGFVFSVSDPQGALASDQGFTSFNFGIAIIPVNDIPNGLDTTYVVPVNVNISDQLYAVDPDDSVFVFLELNGPFNGTISNWDSVGQFTYTPNTGFNGFDSILYTVEDQQGGIDTSTIIFDVQNFSPEVIQGFTETSENNAVTDTLEAFDPNQDPYTFAINTLATKGNVTLINANTGEFSYQPNPGSIGEDFFLFEASDGSLTSAPDTFRIYIRPNIEPGDILVGNGSMLLLIDPNTFEQAPVSWDSLLNEIQGVAYEPNGNIVVIDNQNGIVRIDPNDGSQSILTPDSYFSAGPPGPIGIDVNQNGDIYVADAGSGVYHINPTTGDTTLISSGGSLTVPIGLDIAQDGSLLISDGGAFAMGTSRVIRIDPTSGNQTTISSGDSLEICIGIAEDIDGSILISDAKAAIGNQDLILRIDTATGSQTILSSDTSLVFASGIDVQKNDGRIYIVCQGTSLVLELNRNTNNISAIAQGGFLQNPFAITTIQIPNSPPVLAISIPDTSVREGNNLVFALDPGTFTDPNPFDTLVYSANLSGGGILPSWLNFDQNTITFSGIPTINDTGTISIEVTATDNLNQTAQDEFDLLIYTIVGLTDQKIASIVLFPVPASDYLIVKSQEISGTYIIEISDVKGKTIQKFDRTNMSGLNEKLDVSELISGVYFIKIYNDNYQFTRKFIIE